MHILLSKILPILFIFFLGVLLKRIRLFKKEDGDKFLALVFNVSLPALILLSVSQINLSFDFIFLPICAALIIFGTYAFALMASKFFHFDKKSYAVFLIGSTIINTGFTLPFFIAAYGKEGLARASMFDLANGFLVLTFVYYIAVKHSDNQSSAKTLFKKFLFLPPLWALALAFILNVLDMKLPVTAVNFLESVGNLTTPLIMLALGIYFRPKIVNLKALISVISIRMLFGMVIGLLLVSIFHLEHLNRMIVLINAASPVGYNTMIYSSLENLDTEFAASLVSFSIFFGLFFTPLLIVVLS